VSANTNSTGSVTYGRHKVVRGDTLSTIAQTYGVSVRELKRLNSLSHNKALLGTRLKVPVSKTAKLNVGQSGRADLIYKVKNGDSLSKISAEYNVTISAIKRVNRLSSNTLRKGQKLTIPGAAVSSKTQHRRHKVKRGDTLSEIALKYGSSVAKIKKANKLRSTTVRLGQVLTIP